MSADVRETLEAGMSARSPADFASDVAEALLDRDEGGLGLDDAQVKSLGPIFADWKAEIEAAMWARLAAEAAKRAEPSPPTWPVAQKECDHPDSEIVPYGDGSMARCHRCGDGSFVARLVDDEMW